MKLFKTIILVGLLSTLGGCNPSTEDFPAPEADSNTDDWLVPAMPVDLSYQWQGDELEVSWQDVSSSELYFEIGFQFDIGEWSDSQKVGENINSVSLGPFNNLGPFVVGIRSGNSSGVSDWATLEVLDQDYDEEISDSGLANKPSFKTVPGKVNLHEIDVSHPEGAHLYMGRDDGKGVDMVVVAEGYRADQLSIFISNAIELIDAAMDFHPIHKHLPAWNIHLLALPSNESGADNSTDYGDLVDTRFGARFWCNNIERLLCIDASGVSSEVARHVPQYDEILVLVNSEKYGGAGYSSGIATASLHDSAVDLIRHELGHSFAKLGDEYTYGKSSAPSREPTAANTTLESDPAKVKWKHWINNGTNAITNYGEGIGVWEGAEYYSHGVFRPTQNSLMKSFGEPFYEVNSEAWALAVYEYISPIIGIQPQMVNVDMQLGSSLWFGLESLYDASTVSVTWTLENQQQEISTDSPFLYLFEPELPGTYELTATVTDNTGIIIRQLDSTATQKLSWTIQVN